MGWWIALGVVFLLGILPLGVSARYSGEGALLRVIAGPVRLTLFPRKKKEKKPKPPPKTDKQPGSEEESLPKPPQPPKQEPPADRKEKGGSLRDFLPLVKVALNFLGAFRRKLRVNRLELKLILAGGDPCDLAVSYGRAWAAVGNLMPRLERLLVIKKRDVEVECDFTASETLVIARLDLTVTLGRLLGLAIVYGIRALKEFLKLQKNEKAVLPMSQIPNMLESTIQKIREMVDVNSVIGEPISTPDGVTIIPVSKVSVGFGGGGSDFTKKTTAGDNPFGGGVGGGVKVTPICFLIVKDGNVRMMPVAEPANTTADRIVEMVPDTLDKLTAYLDSKKKD